MSTIQKELQDDDWKKELQDAIIVSMTGEPLKRLSALRSVGRHYTCSAPASLFKYFKGDDRDIETIKANKLWYRAPSKYNDVFDCDIAVDESALKKCAMQLVPDGTKIRDGSYAWKNLQKALHKAKQSLRSTIESLRSSMGVTCFSESDESLLMWAHYANDHRGICVEYDLLEINKQLKFTPVPIIYSKERVCFSVLNPETIEKDSIALFLRSITTKSKEWDYEHEWRIVRDHAACGDRWDSENQGALLDMICPSSITLGCAAEEKTENKLKAYCQEKRIPLYKMQKDEFQYRLNKVAILKFDT